jgi:hypothetical protein
MRQTNPLYSAKHNIITKSTQTKLLAKNIQASNI